MKVSNVDPDYGTIKTASTGETIIIFSLLGYPWNVLGLQIWITFTFISMPYPVQVIE